MADLKELTGRLRRVRSRERRITGVTGSLKVLTTLISGVLCYFLIDWLFDLPYAARLIGAGGVVLALSYVFYKHLFRELGRKSDDDDLALRLEAQNPDLQNRLISTLQLKRAGTGGEYVGSPELIGALEDETLELVAPLDFTQIIKTEMLKRAGIAAAVVVVLQLALAARFPDYFVALGLRLADPAARFPTRTRIKTITCPTRVPRGDDIPVKVVAEGEIPAQGGTLAFNAGGAVTEVELLPAGEDRFEGKLAKALTDLDFTVALGDALSAPIHVTVLQRPEVDTKTSTVKYQFPAYTTKNLRPPPPNAPAPEPDKFGGLSAPAGSTADLLIDSTKPLTEAKLERADGLQMTLEKSDPQGLHWLLKGLPIDKPASYHLLLLDTDGLTNMLPPLEYPIDPRPDQPPAIRLLKPSHDVTVTPTAKPALIFEAHDDYNVRAVRVAYRVQHKDYQGAGETKYFELAGLPQAKDLVNVSFVWELAALDVAIGDQIVFWLEADDDCANPAFRPRRRVWTEEAGTPAPTPAPGPDKKGAPEKIWSRTSDLKLTVISREDKTRELQEELAHLSEMLETSRGNEEDIKSQIRQTQNEMLELK